MNLLNYLQIYRINIFARLICVLPNESDNYNVDETAEGNPFAEFINREDDYDGALDSTNKPVDTKTAEEKNKAAEEKLKRLEKIRADSRKPPDFGNIEKDYQLQQAMNLILGKPVATVAEEKQNQTSDAKSK